MNDGAARPLVTVVIPAYNAEEFLAATIDSVLAQTYRPIEVLVVDDGSQDRTAEIARSFGDPVRLVERPNGGPAAARNTGFQTARGTIIALLDADDLWMPDRLERCVEPIMSDPRVGFVTTDAYLIDEDTPTELRYYGDYQRYPFPAMDAQLDEIAKRNFVFVSAVFDRRLLDLVGGHLDEGLWGTEDYDLWMRFLLTGTRAALISEPLAYYRVRSDSVSRARKRQWNAHLTVLEHHLPSLWLRGARGRPRDAYEIARRLAERGERRLALWFVAHALSDPGSNPLRRLQYALGGIWYVATAHRPRPTGSTGSTGSTVAA